jgi:hypothetical protein
MADTPSIDDVFVEGVTGGGEATHYWVLAFVIVLIGILIYVIWRAFNRRVPNCRSFDDPEVVAGCKTATGLCDGDPACLNVVATCTPVASQIYGQLKKGVTDPSVVIGNLNPNDVFMCSRAIARLDPKVVAAAISKSPMVPSCMPAEVSAQLNNRNTIKAIDNVMLAAIPLAPFAVKIAQNMPACPVQAPMAPGGVLPTPPGFFAGAAPLPPGYNGGVPPK